MDYRIAEELEGGLIEVGREYFKVFHSYLKSIEPLDDAERGRLFTAMLEYSITGEVPELTGNERFIFPTMQANIDREAENYRNTVERNRKNGKTGGRPAQNPKNPDGFLENPKNPDGFLKSQDKDKDKDKEEDKEKENTPKPPDAFDEFWAAYPKKKSKGAARKAWDKLKPSPEMRAMILRSIERAKQSSDWLEADGKYIPYPATWLNAEGWEDGVEEEKPREDPGKYAKPWPEFKPGMSWEDLIP